MLKFKRVIGLAITGALAISMFAGCDALPQEEPSLPPPLIVPDEVSYNTKTVERGDIEDSTTVNGKIVPGYVEYLYVDKKYTRLSSMKVGLGDKVAAGDVVFDLITDDWDDDIEFATINIDTMKTDIQTMKELYEIEKSMDEATLVTLETPYAIDNHKKSMEIKRLNYENQLKAKENALAIETIKLETMKNTVADSKIRSSIDGTVVYLNKNYEAGDTIVDYDKLIGIADESDFQIEYKGMDADKFDIGAHVMVTYLGEEHEAMVTMNPSTVPEDEKELYSNTVFFDFVEDLSVVRGTVVKIKLTHAKSEDTLLIPKSLVLKSGDDRLVYVLVDGLKQERYITTGVESGIFIEVTKGLSEGEQLIID